MRGVERERGEDGEAEMEEGSHRCGGARGDTSHYGANCSSGDVVGRAERSPARGVNQTHARTQKQTHAHVFACAQEENRENIWMCATCLEEVISFTRKMGRGGGFVPSWTCNLHARLHQWERMEDEVESEERANRMTHFTRIMC